MHGFEQYSHAYQPYATYNTEIKQEQMVDMSFDPLVFTTDMFGQPQQDFKYEMMRSMSQNSFHQSLSSTSASSSTVGSPYSNHAQIVPEQTMFSHEFTAGPAIYTEDFPTGFESAHYELEATLGHPKMEAPFVDPILIQGQHPAYPNYANYASQHQQINNSAAPSPAPSTQSYHSFHPPVTAENFGEQHAVMRRQSITSLRSPGSPRSTYSGDDSENRCNRPDCGKIFKDLKAHMLTHMEVRPEKCPVPSCEYHIKGFSRKYDKNRHTLTHWRGTMVCGFCPGSGSAVERTFNRADVFKKHLTNVHGVEQPAPNGRKRSPTKVIPKLTSYCPDATGKCSTCGQVYNSAQDFYEHLDDCVLKVVQQEDPTESVNAQLLGEVVNDSDVQATFERNQIKLEDDQAQLDDIDEGQEEEDEDDEDEGEYNERSGRGVIKAIKVTSSRAIIGGNVSKKTMKAGLTRSRGGGSIIGKNRKRRKFYPPSWGMATDKMNMKKRVLCIYDGQRRLHKDDMMMHNEFEVRMPIPETNSYVTDLDIETMKRAEAFHNATPEEKGPWYPEQDFLQWDD